MSGKYTVYSVAAAQSLLDSTPYDDWLYCLRIAAQKLGVDPNKAFDKKTARQLVKWVNNS
jgi:hypothetical protein